MLADLAELGVAAARVEPAARQTAGVFVARGRGRRRPAAARQGLRPRRLRQPAAREALAHALVPERRAAAPAEPARRRSSTRRSSTLLAGQAGVPTRTVVTAGESPRPATRCSCSTTRAPLERAPGRARRRAAPGLLGDARPARRAPGSRTSDRPGDARASWTARGARRLRRGTIAPRPDQLLTDRAQLLARPPRSSGRERAIAAARGTRRRRRASPRCCRTSRRARSADAPLRQALKAAEIDVDELRAGGRRGGRRRERPSRPAAARHLVDARPARAARARGLDAARRAISGLDYDTLRASLDGRVVVVGRGRLRRSRSCRASRRRSRRSARCPAKLAVPVRST